MSPSATALGIIFAIVAAGVVIGFFAGARRKMDLEQWTVAGRGFGLLLMWLLMAGEVYTTFSFLGASGWAYSRGAPTLYILAYITLAYVVSFFILPPIWELGRRHQLQTQSDFFAWRYGSKYLAAAVSLVGIVFMIPYLELQLTGLGIIVEVASFDGISRVPAMIFATILLCGFVLASGLRAVAWVSVLKDILMLFAAISVGIADPLYSLRRDRPDVHSPAARQAHALRNARRDLEPRPRLVHLDCPANWIRSVHVAALVRRSL